MELPARKSTCPPPIGENTNKVTGHVLFERRRLPPAGQDYVESIEAIGRALKELKANTAKNEARREALEALGVSRSSV